MVFVNAADKDIKKRDTIKNIPDTIVADSDNKYIQTEIPNDLKVVGEELFVPITEGEEFDREETHLKEVISDIRYEIAKIEEQPTFVNRYETVRGGDDGTESAQLSWYKSASQIDYTRINELNNMAREPFRIRVDIKENNKVKTVYLGPIANKG